MTCWHGLHSSGHTHTLAHDPVHPQHLTQVHPQPHCTPLLLPPQEGILAFYKGWLPSVIGVIPYVGLNFGVYETLKATLLKSHGKKLEQAPAAFDEQIIVKWYEWWLNFLLCCLRVWRCVADRGTNTTVPFSSSMSMIIDKRSVCAMAPLTGLKDERELSVGARLACGAAAGTTGQTVAYPFDVARRRLQVSGWQGARELHSDHGQVVAYRGMVDCFVRTVREEGVQALFKVGGWRAAGCSEALACNPKV